MAFAIGSGDYPHVRRHKLSKLPYTEGVAPVLMFGSAFRDPGMYSNMMAMPMPEPHHLFCFTEWLVNGRVCKEMREMKGQLVFGKEDGQEWQDLIVSSSIIYVI